MLESLFVPSSPTVHSLMGCIYPIIHSLRFTSRCINAALTENVGKLLKKWSSFAATFSPLRPR